VVCRQSLCARGCTETRDRICGENKGLAARKDITAIVSAFPYSPPQIEQKCCLANAPRTRGQALKKKLKYPAAAVALLAAAIYLNNTNLLARHHDGPPVLLAHRGMAQRF